LEFLDISRVLEAITAKRMKTDPYCQRRNCSSLNVLFSDIGYTVLISQGIPQLGDVKQRWDGKNKSSYTRGCRAPGVSYIGFLVLSGIANLRASFC